MGIMSCARGSCEYKPCDRYSYMHGYICNKCFEELVYLGEDIGIDGFMESEPLDIDFNMSRIYFDKVFKEV